MNPILRRYIADTWLPTLVYFASVFAAAVLSSRIDSHWLRALAGALPLPALAWMAWVELQRLRRRDELRQRIELETMTIAFALSFGIVAALTFIGMYGAIELPLYLAAFIMAFCWVGAQLWVRARYGYWWQQGATEEPPEEHRNDEVRRP
ncbi:MAG TPA: hypothetical protein PKO41_01805 [Dokdonella sp.]|uniref:hypothetical protein n=1 Tax=Dokdonella sp. TaxID=2291710 RepID=UPI0025C30C91|nr:hypothetical protein [Dokdonella sp.]MBX3691373.1 hypothetical protein [Dokdonella sp.]MCW5568589.1 hypothetical protein [Dokdonella sp.]HNR91136.1 hypothetical protein [Dokdonella sp.]